ncbi:hypothetical protein BLOT_002044 [Blomia tropicalis]|nr:hypothetical protein BLOT_002044 [Blomia tropicalis]
MGDTNVRISTNMTSPITEANRMFYRKLDQATQTLRQATSNNTLDCATDKPIIKKAYGYLQEASFVAQTNNSPAGLSSMETIEEALTIMKKIGWKSGGKYTTTDHESLKDALKELKSINPHNNHRNDMETIMKKLEEQNAIIEKQNETIIQLSQRIDKLESLHNPANGHSNKSTTQSISQPKPLLYSAIVKSTTGSNTKQTLTTTLKPHESRTNIVSTNTLKSGDLQINFATDNERDEFVNSINKLEQFTAINKRIKPISKRIFMGIYSQLTNDDVIESIAHAAKINKEEINKHVKHRFTSKNKNEELQNHVIDILSTELNEYLNNNDRVLIGYQNIKQSHHTSICFKCQKIGNHIAKHCTTATPICSHCGNKHQAKACPNISDPSKARCINCIATKKETFNHPSHSKTCPTLLKFRNDGFN